MKSLYNETDLNEIISRIENLPADAQRQWGKMNVGQMLAHCSEPFRQAFGEIKLKRTLPGILFGGFAKKMVTGNKPFKQGLPTDKEFIFKDDKDFDEEKKKLLDAVRRFGEGKGNNLTTDPHPFFGKMSIEEWDMLFYKHLDHHLRQFGA
ncbi:MAG: DUF1569 domain-containing protein [Ignavibacteriae bacterium]|nr:DUF1569 domain-containing protein [Ignavibacteriota bacterium]